ncbi:AEC family transporter [Seleniivibrio sp.]|uniref:AEC family transporter n=1 Tax=Seleniivibrio sp. TaxID=2898801 RepID=UPI0025D8509C|nr:AEC family transporter [Seleniivibrio sp.]MCD8552861.1 AEC family transporter [Seleniivibrio sp.]
MTYSGIFAVLLPYMAFAFLGGAANRIGLTRGKPEKIILKVYINFLVPVLIVNYVVGNEVLNDIGNVISAPLVAFYGIVAGYILSLLTAKYFGVEGRDSKASFAFTVGIYNYGFISIPLTEFLLGKSAVGLLLVHNIGIDTAYWSVGIGMLTGFSIKNMKALLKNPPLIAIFASLAVNFIFGASVMPQWFKTAIHPIVVAAIPIGIFVSGATLAETASALVKKGGWKVSMGAVILRMFVIPAFMVFTVMILPVSHELKMITAVQASMPAGMLSIVIVKYFGGDVETAAQTIFTTTLVSLFTIPLWIAFFMKILA